MNNVPTKKRILFVEQNQDGTVGGSHHSLFYLVKALDKNKYEAFVLFYEESKIIDQFRKENIVTIVFKKPLGTTFNPPVAILTIPFIIIRKLYNLLITSVIPFFKFIIFILKNKVDLIHLNNTAHTGWEWLFASKLLKKKCITHQRGFGEFGYISKMISLHFDKIICISDAVATYLYKADITDNTKTIHNAIDVQDFRAKVKRTSESVKGEFGINNICPLLGVVGNFQKWKGQHIVVRALEKLTNKHPDLRCLLIGNVSRQYKQDWEYYEKLRYMISQKNLNNNIVFTGYRSDIPDLVNSLDILIHCSIEPEPFGRVVLEGMCLGKPVIATDLGGPREIIENGVSGVLVPPNDPEMLSEKIDFLLEHDKIRINLGENASKRVSEMFALDKFSYEINLLYNQILA